MINQLPISHNLTNEEYLRLHGTLSAERIERLVERESAMEGIDSIIAWLQDTDVSPVEEGFTNPVTSILRGILASTRTKSIKDQIETALELLDDMEKQYVADQEFSQENLNNAIAEAERIQRICQR